MLDTLCRLAINLQESFESSSIVMWVVEKSGKGIGHFLRTHIERRDFDRDFLENLLNEKFLKKESLPFMVRSVYTPVFSLLARKNNFYQIMHFHRFFRFQSSKIGSGFISAQK